MPMQMPLFKVDYPLVASSDKCPDCGSTLYKFDEKSLKQDGLEAFRKCKNSSCRLHGIVLPLGRMKDISDDEIHNFRNREDRQIALAEGKSPFEAYDATTSLKYDSAKEMMRNYRFNQIKCVVLRNFNNVRTLKNLRNPTY